VAYELYSKLEVAHIFSCGLPRVEDLAGPPDAIIQWTDSREVPGWLSDRIELNLAGIPAQRATCEPIKLYGIRESARLLETSCIKAEKLLGTNDALFFCGAREYPLWSNENVNAAWRLLDELWQAGDQSFKVRTYKRKPKPPRTRREFTFSRRPKPASRVRFCSPRHVWADPKEVEACRVRKN
jgi:hypothetical protein